MLKLGLQGAFSLLGIHLTLLHDLCRLLHSSLNESHDVDVPASPRCSTMRVPKAPVDGNECHSQMYMAPKCTCSQANESPKPTCLPSIHTSQVSMPPKPTCLPSEGGSHVYMPAKPTCKYCDREGLGRLTVGEWEERLKLSQSIREVGTGWLEILTHI